jgi:hypothetical protein
MTEVVTMIHELYHDGGPARACKPLRAGDFCWLGDPVVDGGEYLKRFGPEQLSQAAHR